MKGSGKLKSKGSTDCQSSLEQIIEYSIQNTPNVNQSQHKKGKQIYSHRQITSASSNKHQSNLNFNSSNNNFANYKNKFSSGRKSGKNNTFYFIYFPFLEFSHHEYDQQQPENKKLFHKRTNSDHNFITNKQLNTGILKNNYISLGKSKSKGIISQNHQNASTSPQTQYGNSLSLFQLSQLGHLSNTTSQHPHHTHTHSHSNQPSPNMNINSNSNSNTILSAKVTIPASSSMKSAKNSPPHFFSDRKPSLVGPTSSHQNNASNYKSVLTAHNYHRKNSPSATINKNVIFIGGKKFKIISTLPHSPKAQQPAAPASHHLFTDKKVFHKKNSMPDSSEINITVEDKMHKAQSKEKFDNVKNKAKEKSKHEKSASHIAAGIFHKRSSSEGNHVKNGKKADCSHGKIKTQKEPNCNLLFPQGDEGDNVVVYSKNFASSNADKGETNLRLSAKERELKKISNIAHKISEIAGLKGSQSKKELVESEYYLQSNTFGSKSKVNLDKYSVDERLLHNSSLNLEGNQEKHIQYLLSQYNQIKNNLHSMDSSNLNPKLSNLENKNAQIGNKSSSCTRKSGTNAKGDEKPFSLKINCIYNRESSKSSKMSINKNINAPKFRKDFSKKKKSSSVNISKENSIELLLANSNCPSTRYADEQKLLLKNKKKESNSHSLNASNNQSLSQIAASPIVNNNSNNLNSNQNCGANFRDDQSGKIISNKSEKSKNNIENRLHERQQRAPQPFLFQKQKQEENSEGQISSKGKKLPSSAASTPTSSSKSSIKFPSNSTKPPQKSNNLPPRQKQSINNLKLNESSICTGIDLFVEAESVDGIIGTNSGMDLNLSKRVKKLDLEKVEEQKEKDENNRVERKKETNNKNPKMLSKIPIYSISTITTTAGASEGSSAISANSATSASSLPFSKEHSKETCSTTGNRDNERKKLQREKKKKEKREAELAKIAQLLKTGINNFCFSLFNLNLFFIGYENSKNNEILTVPEFYKIGKMLGKGAFGKVNLGIHKLTRKLVAVKSINLKFLSESSSKNKVMKEVNILKQIRHPSVIRFFIFIYLIHAFWL